MAPLIAEDLLLLLLDKERGRVATSFAPTALGGALLAELALSGAITIQEKPRRWNSAKVQAVPGVSVTDPLLQDALAQVRLRERSAQSLVERLGKRTVTALGDRLVERGIVERRDSKLWGLFPRTRWPAVDGRDDARLREELRTALVVGLDPQPRTATLIALLAAVDRAHTVVDRAGVSRRQIRRRAKQIAQAQASDAVAATTAAVAAAVTASATAASAG